MTHPTEILSALEHGGDVSPDDILLAFIHEGLTNGRDRRAETATALQALAYVLGKNYAAAEASEKEGVFSLTFKVTFDRNESPTSVKAVASCSRISKADIELTCPVEED
jgi:hypothetical protein